MKERAARTRNCCFTVNNYTEEEYNNILKLPFNYCVIGKEVGENGTPHLQGYFEAPNMRTYSGWKKQPGLERAHLETRKGTPTEAANYCKKDNNWKEIGEISRQGFRTELQETGNDVKEGKDIKTIAMERPDIYIKFHKGINALKTILQEHRVSKPKCYWFYGPTGVGKTYRAKNLGKSYYIKNSSKWWDDYNQEDVIIIDDFRKDNMPFDYLLRLLDENKCIGEIKGGFVKINSPIIVITCDVGPHSYWQDNDLDQLKRRLDGGVHYYREMAQK